MSRLIKQIQNYVFEHDLIKPGSKIIVGVSGGPDSVFLLDILMKLSKKYKTVEGKGLEFKVAHINYALRGDDSKKDAEFVARLAGSCGLDFSLLDCKKSKDILCKELKKYKKTGKGNLENIARKIRYDFFENVRKEHNFDLIAVGHNLDDQAETVLMRIFRGAGLQGLSGISPKQGKIIRPLLSIRRADIEAYLKKNKLDFKIDKTNLENDFLRNKIRNKLIPYLEKEFNPKIKETLVNLSMQASYENDFLNEIIKRDARKLTKNCGENCLEFSAKSFVGLGAIHSTSLLRKMIFIVRKDLVDIEKNNLREIVKVIRSVKSKSQIARFKGLELKRKGDKITLTKYE